MSVPKPTSASPNSRPESAPCVPKRLGVTRGCGPLHLGPPEDLLLLHRAQISACRQFGVAESSLDFRLEQVAGWMSATG